MKNSIIRKTLIIGIIILFIGASIIPSISGNNRNTSIMNTTDNISHELDLATSRTDIDVDDDNIKRPLKSTSSGIFTHRGITLYVGGSGPGNYTTIQDAIDDASDGDIVYVYNGTYFENVVVDKRLDLIGEDKESTIIDASGYGDVVKVTADYVNVSGFSIQNSGFAGKGLIYLYFCNNVSIVNCELANGSHYGIYLLCADYNNIINNSITDVLIGIGFWCGSNNILIGNTITGIQEGTLYMNTAIDLQSNSFNNIFRENDITISGEVYGFHFGSSNNDIDTSNTINGVPGVLVLSNVDTPTAIDGLNMVYPELTYATNIGLINLYNCRGIIIRNCELANNSGYGIRIHESSRITITGNNITNNQKDGICIGLSILDKITGNNIANNLRNGIHISDAHTTIIEDNNITKNQNYGIYLGKSVLSNVTGNMIIDNKIGIRLYNPDPGSSRRNVINDNIIIDNSESGISVSGEYNIITGNTIRNIQEDSIYPKSAISVGGRGNVFRENNITVSGSKVYGIYFGCPYPFEFCCSFDNDIDISNTINGVPGVLVLSNVDTPTVIDGLNMVYPELTYATDYGLIILYKCSNVTIRNCELANNSNYGIYLYDSSENNITGNTIENHNSGIRLRFQSNNNSISENLIANNEHGLNITDPYGTNFPSSNNTIYHNNFIDNTQHARDTNDNIWDDGYPSGGNYWDDHPNLVDDFSGPRQNISGSDGIVDTPYSISGGKNQDRYPLMASYPSMDLFITDFSAEYVSKTTMKLKATIKKTGNADISMPFQVSFYRTNEGNEHDDIHFNNRVIGNVEIPSLGIGETTEATILWDIQPEICTISVFADSTRVIEESDESNNWASITISYLLWKSLIKTVDAYSKLNQQYQISYAPSAEEVVVLAQEALSVGVFTNPQEYVQRMKKIAELERWVGIELEGQILGSLLLHKYQEAVEYLITLIDELTDNHHTTPGITWEDAEAVAETQLKLCEIVMQMIK